MIFISIFFCSVEFYFQEQKEHEVAESRKRGEVIKKWEREASRRKFYFSRKLCCKIRLHFNFITFSRQLTDWKEVGTKTKYWVLLSQRTLLCNLRYFSKLKFFTVEQIFVIQTYAGKNEIKIYRSIKKISLVA